MFKLEQDGTAKYTLPKTERLTGKKAITSLFSHGESFFIFPLKVCWFPRQSPENLDPPQLLISVSKRNFKKAVHRNRIKRLIREAYRLHKQEFNAIPINLIPETIGLVYVGKELPNFSDIEKKLISVLRRFNTTGTNPS